MALHHDLLEQAGHLVSRERKRPRQASLRRSVSAAYYALFHLLVSESAWLLSPRQPPGLRNLIRRAFNHSEMRVVCQGFIQGSAAAARNRSAGNIPAATRALLTLPLEPELISVLEAFVDLQEARHQADYDVQKIWHRLDAATHVATVRSAFANWQTVRRTPNAAVLAAALLLQRHWGR